MVEINECKIGRRKLEMGHAMEGKWELSMIDGQMKEVCLKICPENRRDTH